MVPIDTSFHAFQRRGERSASQSQIDEVLKTGRRRNTAEKGDNGGFVWFYEKEFAGRVLRLVVEVTGKDASGAPDGKIATLYWLKKMSKKHTHHIIVESASAPTIELDPGSSGIYIRFSRKPVHETVEKTQGYPMILVDLDKDGAVVGIESVGFKDINVKKIKEITEKARVAAPVTMDWESAKFEAVCA